MEVFLGVDEVQQHMSDYYPPPEDAKMHLQVVCSLRDRLDIINDAQSSEMLAYKDALLDAVVMGNLRGKGQALGRVLQVRPENFWRASRRRARLESPGGSHFSLPKCWKM
jgi:hypothetical protein